MLGVRLGFLEELPKPERTEKGKSLLEFPDTYVVIDIETTQRTKPIRNKPAYFRVC